MPKPPWLYEQRAWNAKGSDVLGSGADWTFDNETLHEAQDDAVSPPGQRDQRVRPGRRPSVG